MQIGFRQSVVTDVPGTAGRQRVQERFTIAHTVRKMEGIYQYLLNRK